MIEAVAFDLDDTLTLERDYVRSGFRAVADYLQGRVAAECDWYGALWRNFESGERGQAFDRVLREAALAPAPALVAELVRVYREHRPTISLFPDVAAALERLPLPRARLGVITDGVVISQRTKFEALGLAPYFGHVIYTDGWGLEFRKPHPRGFLEFERLAAVPPERCAYFGDNPAKDFTTPHARGWLTVRVWRPGGLNEACPSAPGEVDRTVRDFAALSNVLGLEK